MSSRQLPDTELVEPFRAPPIDAESLSAEELERFFLSDRMAFHQDSLRPLGERTAAESALEVLVFRKAQQDDLDCIAPDLRLVVVDVGEHASFCRLGDEGRVRGMKQRDHRAGRLVDDPVDEIQRMLGAHSEPDECDVGALACRCGRHLSDVHLPSDDLMTEGGDDRGNVGQTIRPFVRD